MAVGRKRLKEKFGTLALEIKTLKSRTIRLLTSTCALTGLRCNNARYCQLHRIPPTEECAALPNKHPMEGDNYGC